jgi:hypothetical protein
MAVHVRCVHCFPRLCVRARSGGAASPPPKVVFPGGLHFPVDRVARAAHPSPLEAQMDTLLRQRARDGNNSRSALEEAPLPLEKLTATTRRHAPTPPLGLIRSHASSRAASAHSASGLSLYPSTGGVVWPLGARNAVPRFAGALHGASQQPSAADAKTAGGESRGGKGCSSFGAPAMWSEGSLFPGKGRIKNSEFYSNLQNS